MELSPSSRSYLSLTNLELLHDHIRQNQPQNFITSLRELCTKYSDRPKNLNSVLNSQHSTFDEPRRPLLFHAIAGSPSHEVVHGNINALTQMVSALIEAGADPNLVSEDSQSTALHEASRRGRLDIIVLLRRNGAVLQKLNREKATPLEEAFSTAASTGVTPLPLLQALAYKLNVCISSEVHNEPYHDGVMFHDIQRGWSIQRYISITPSLCDPEESSISSGVSGGVLWSALHHAAACLNKTAFFEIASVLDELKIVRRVVNFQDVDGWSPLHWLVARYVTLGTEDPPGVKTDILEMINRFRNTWNWRTRVASPTGVRHPLLFQTFVLMDDIERSVITFPCMLHWPYDSQSQRLQVMMWNTYTSKSSGEKLEAFYRPNEQRLLQICTVRSSSDGCVSGDLTFPDLTINSTEGHIIPMHIIQDSISTTAWTAGSFSSQNSALSTYQFESVQSLLPFYYHAAQTDSTALSSWSVKNHNFTFRRVIEVTYDTEKYEIDLFPGSMSSSSPGEVIQTTLMLSRTSISRNVISISCVNELFTFEHIHQSSLPDVPARCILFHGLTPLHWMEQYTSTASPAESETLLKTSNIGDMKTTLDVKASVSNIRNDLLMAFAANPKGWGTTSHTRFGLIDKDHNIGLYLLHCACAAGADELVFEIV
eukprot:PhF_6_TR30188/c0_g1_i1/m.44340